MSDPDIFIQDVVQLSRGLIPQNIDEILVDRTLADNSTIKNYYNNYHKKGKFSDLITDDLDYVYKKKSPQLRPIISSLGGGKSTLLIQIDHIARQIYGDKAVVVKINMSSYPDIDASYMKKYVFKEIFIQIRPQIIEILKELGGNFSLPFVNDRIIDDLSSGERSREERAFRELIGETRSMEHDHYYFQINGAKEFLIELFKKSNKMLVLLFDEVDMFVRGNKDRHPETIDIFTYTFLRDLTDRAIDGRPIYVVFTCEKEMYEYIRTTCLNFQRVADTHEITMKEFNDSELLLLADNIYNGIFMPLYGRSSGICQLSQTDIRQLIDNIHASDNNNVATPGNFTKQYVNAFLSYYNLGLDGFTKPTSEYEKLAFLEFEKIVKKKYPDFRCDTLVQKQGHNFDGYGELIKRGSLIKRAYAEFTSVKADSKKVETFIDWLEHLKKTNDYDEKNDMALFISPDITPDAQKRLKYAKIDYHEYKMNNNQKEVKKDKNKKDLSKLKSIILEHKTWKKYRNLQVEILAHHSEYTEQDIDMVTEELLKNKLITINSDRLSPNVRVTFNN